MYIRCVRTTSHEMNLYVSLLFLIYFHSYCYPGKVCVTSILYVTGINYCAWCNMIHISTLIRSVNLHVNFHG